MGWYRLLWVGLLWYGLVGIYVYRFSNALSRHSSSFKTIYNDILELASNVLADANKRVQEKIEEMEKLKSDLESNGTICLSNLNHDEKNDE